MNICFILQTRLKGSASVTDRLEDYFEAVILNSLTPAMADKGANEHDGDEVMSDDEVKFDPFVDYMGCNECTIIHPAMWKCEICEWAMHWHVCCDCCVPERSPCEACNSDRYAKEIDSDEETVPYSPESQED